MRQALRQLAADGEIRGDAAAAVETRRDIIARGLQAGSPDLPNDVLQLARLLRRYGRFSEAVDWLGKLDRFTAVNHRLKLTILLSMAYDLSDLGRYDDAESALQRASTLSVGWELWLQRRRLRSTTTGWDLAMAHGYVATLSGRFQDARGWYESARSLSMTLAQAKRLASIHNLASTNLELGDLENAERRVQEVNELAGSDSWPGRDHFTHLTGKLRLAQGRRKEARDMLSGVLALRGAEPGVLLSFAEVAYGEGRFDEANAYVAQIQTNPVDAPTRQRLAETLERLTEVDEAAGRQVEAEERRRRANALRQKPPAQAPLADDGLLRRVQSKFAGQCFGPPGPIQSLALGLYLAAFLSLAVSIVLPLDLPFPIPVIQAVALILLVLGWPRLIRWGFGPRPCAENRS